VTADTAADAGLPRPGSELETARGSRVEVAGGLIFQTLKRSDDALLQGFEPHLAAVAAGKDFGRKAGHAGSRTC
jgi:hypothetical protein